MARNNTAFIIVKLYRAWKLILREFNQSHFLVIIDVENLNKMKTETETETDAFLEKISKIFYLNFELFGQASFR